MCQAYDGERAFIIGCENSATIEGFVAARKGLPKTANPHRKFGIYDSEAWDHGWDCWRHKVLPWALEREYHLKGKILEAMEARAQFESSGKIPAELERLLS